MLLHETVCLKPSAVITEVRFAILLAFFAFATGCGQGSSGLSPRANEDEIPPPPVPVVAQQASPAAATSAPHVVQIPTHGRVAAALANSKPPTTAPRMLPSSAPLAEHLVESTSAAAPIESTPEPAVSPPIVESTSTPALVPRAVETPVAASPILPAPRVVRTDEAIDARSPVESAVYDAGSSQQASAAQIAASARPTSNVASVEVTSAQTRLRPNSLHTPARQSARPARLAQQPAALAPGPPAVENLPPPSGGNPPPVETMTQRLQLPKELPGANSPPLQLPPDGDPRRQSVVQRLFPELPPIRPDILPRPRPDRRPLGLLDLEQMAQGNSPVLAQAAADVTSYLGTAIQVGTHPNPIAGYEADTVTSSQTRNYQGIYFQQLIKTAGKLALARGVANMDAANAQLTLRRTYFEILSQVKSDYFAVLVAEESVIINDALVRFMTVAYRIQTEQAEHGASTAYEPAQLRALLVQARTALIQSKNRYAAAWKQLAATVGIPDLPAVPLMGSAQIAVPALSYEAALNRMLSIHPDMQAARNLETQARTQLRLDLVKPIPDVNLYGTFQRDFTTPGLRTIAYNLQVGIPLPIFDRNRGGILNARGDLARAVQQESRVRNDLAGRLADAYNRYESSRIELQNYRDLVLPDYVRAYRGSFSRHQQQPEEVGFADVVVAQSLLATAMGDYINALNSQWTALADLANLLQVERLQELDGETVQPAPLVPNAGQGGRP